MLRPHSKGKPSEQAINLPPQSSSHCQGILTRFDYLQVLWIKGCTIGNRNDRLQTTTEEIRTTMNAMTHDIRVMTSGAFTAAYLELIPQLERLTKKNIVTAATSIGTGENSIPSRIQRGEPVDVVIVADAVLVELIKDGLVLAESYTPLARSAIGMAVRAGAPKPDISSVEALKRTLLQAESIAYSASVSGQYLTTELLQRLRIADQVLPKCRRAEGGERIGAVIARGDAEIGFQQISELLPVPGVAHVTPLPAEVQKVSVFSAGVAATSADPAAAYAILKFLASPEASAAITKSGMEPIENR
jgi:molybdate transport system substrate-binding protein